MNMLISLAVPSQPTLKTVSIGVTSAQTVTLTASNLLVQSDVACFVLRGTNPVATTSCLPLLANTQYRLTGMQEGEKLAIITASGTGTFSYVPGV